MAGQASNGQQARAVSRGVRAACAAALLSALPACSYGIPSLMPDVDEMTTGSVVSKPVVLDGRLDGEDWRRARAALAVALDPQGNGRAVSWDNPETGAGGSITADGPPFVEADLICRRFAATVSRSGAERPTYGKACKPNADEWDLREIRATRMRG